MESLLPAEELPMPGVGDRVALWSQREARADGHRNGAEVRARREGDGRSMVVRPCSRAVGCCQDRLAAGDASQGAGGEQDTACHRIQAQNLFEPKLSSPRAHLKNSPFQ